MIGRRSRPTLAVGPGERLLAWAEGGPGVMVGGTREALYLVDAGRSEPLRIPWEQVQAADWDRDTGVLRVSEVGDWGDQRPEHRVELDDPRLLLQLVRERVSASVLIQRRVVVDGRRGLRVIARRASSGERDVTWVFEYDEGIDPADPAVGLLAQEALAAAREEIGLS
ncbi:MAG: hypothetical protein KDB63_09755 [Nocardioidaceae bacterium]|nr:hypothetical protein [Nocardioidaceae bacterium]